jgi:hypothetical protein
MSALPAPVGDSVPYSIALNPFSEKRMENASSYQIGRESIPNRRTKSARRRMAAILALKVLSCIQEFYQRPSIAGITKLFGIKWMPGLEK